MKILQPEPLRPRQVGGRHRMTPPNMSRVDFMTRDHVEAAQRISLSIFTDMSNAGFSLREALAAVYISGLAHTCAVMAEKN